MATFWSGTSWNGYRLRLELWEEWADANANTSGVRSQLFLHNDSSRFSWKSNGSHWISGNNVWSISNQTITVPSYNTSILLSDRSITHTHSNTGSGSASASGDFTNVGTPYGYNCPYLSVSGSIGLTDFNRSPGQPSWVSAVVNSNKTITVEAASVSSPAGTPTYYVSYSDNGGTSWSAELTMDASRKFTYTNLQRSKTYVFRVRVYNVDGYSGFTNSIPVFLPSGGKRFDGTNFIPTNTAKRYDVVASSWVDINTAKRYNAATSSWEDLT